jgi:hypothetical protein
MFVYFGEHCGKCTGYLDMLGKLRMPILEEEDPADMLFNKTERLQISTRK